MQTSRVFRCSRRSFLAASGGAAVGALLPGLAGSDRRRSPKLSPRRRVPGGRTSSAPRIPRPPIWSYNGAVPGPEIRVRQGERLRITVENRLDEETTVHWHGLRVPNADGRRAAPDAAADRARRDLRLRVRRPRCRHLLVPPASAQLRAGRARPVRAADRRGAGADPGRPRRHLGARRLASAAGRPDQRRLRQLHGQRATMAGSATRSRSTAASWRRFAVAGRRARCACV